jgi:hypothetical protein
VYPNGETNGPESPSAEYFTLVAATPDALLAAIIEPRSSACNQVLFDVPEPS